MDGSNYRMDQDLTLGRNCSTFLEYDPIKGGITFDLKLGDCDMTAKSIKTKKQKFIQFNQILSVAQKQPHKVRFGPAAHAKPRAKLYNLDFSF